MLIFHGYGKISGGPDTWEKIGGNMGHFGIQLFPVFWGLMAALAESLGSTLLMIGFLFRPAAAVLAFTMLVAIVRHVSLPADAPGAGFAGASHAIELFSVYVGLLLLGPGKYGLRWVRRSREN
jgi:putative oxidoreductase